MKVAITGGTGLLGGNLAMAALARGDSVVCTRRERSRTAHLGRLPIEWRVAPLGDPLALAEAFADAQLVVHCAAALSLARRPTPELVATNVEGTRNVIEAVRAAGTARLVHCSSVVAVGASTTGEPCDETHAWNLPELGMDDGYATTKRWAEELVLDEVRTGLDAVIVNPTYMLGPYDARPSSGRMIVSVVHGSAYGHTGGWNNFVDVRDVAGGILRAAASGRRGERYILGGENLSYREIMVRIASLAGVPLRNRAVPRWLARLTGLGGDLLQAVRRRESFINSMSVRWSYLEGFIFTSEKARRELGYDPGPVDKAIVDALAWFRENGLLPAAPR